MNNYKKNNDNKRYYPLRDSKDPYKINLIQITEEQYRSLYPEIWRIQKREQYHHRCMCPKKYIWKCDGNCDLCEYHTAGDTLSLDANICSEGDSQFNILDSTAENNANVEEIILDKILMKPKYYDAIVNGVKAKDFPPVPVDYGYRDSTNFWYTPSKGRKAISEPVPAPKEIDIDSIKYAANRCDPDIKFTDEALMNFVKVPRPFLKTVLMGCVDWAKENNVTLITDEHVKIINDKRNAEKAAKKKK